jgi:hypothetical protein
VIAGLSSRGRKFAAFGTTLAVVLLGAAQASAEVRWLTCKYTHGGQERSLAVAFDESRNLAAIFDDGQLVEGNGTLVTFQAIRSRFPRFTMTYNRNDGALALAMIGGSGFTAGLVHGECRRSNPPPGAPRI